MISTSLYLKIRNMRFINILVLVLNVLINFANISTDADTCVSLRSDVPLCYYYYYYYYYVNNQSTQQNIYNLIQRISTTKISP